MSDRPPKIIDMTPQGEFVASPREAFSARGARVTWPMRIGLGAALVAAVAGGLAVAAVFLWVASVLVPVALIAAIVAYGAFKFQRWRLRR
jgi:hypothetical protein